MCESVHKLTNMGIDDAKQLYFQAEKGIGKFDKREDIQKQ